MKKSIRVALTLLVALVAAGVVAHRHWHGKAAGSAQASSFHGRFIVPPGATAFAFGRLHFTACELPQTHSAATTTAFCAPFEVPENWDAPEGRKIGLRLALIASAEAADDDFLALLAGGPGQSAIDSWPQVAAAFAQLRKHRHVLLLDQRGTGGSNALTCKHDEAEDQGFDLGRIRAQTQACLAAVSAHADPRDYTTSMALRDLEAVRQALGAPQFDLVGVSYGTRVAQQYLHRYPDAVRSVVLDSAVPNEHAIGSEFARNLDDALKAHAAACTATPACKQAFGDPWAKLRELRDELRAKPAEVAYRDPRDNTRTSMRLDAYSLATLARLYAYLPETSALLPLAVAQALKGDYAPLVAQVQMLGGELEGLSDNAMQLSVICSEDADLITPQAGDADSLLGAELAEAFKAQCTIWPHGARPDDFHAPVASDKPVLILSGELDPVTPPRYGEQIVKTLPNGRLLVAKGQGHSVMGRGCFPKLVARFVDALDPHGLDAGCIADFGPTPAFIDYNGAAP
ncbi:alpha/beta fold hydrolase [Dokdonella soli]|uniref:Alpha/beta hydrolase n=1 Tax=Dokdonella soli TaxID=529810 RepID=A0ABN1IG06_9GAMM